MTYSLPARADAIQLWPTMVSSHQITSGRKKAIPFGSWCVGLPGNAETFHALAGAADVGEGDRVEILTADAARRPPRPALSLRT
jgi:hypothetical protein